MAAKTFLPTHRSKITRNDILIRDVREYVRTHEPVLRAILGEFASVRIEVDRAYMTALDSQWRQVRALLLASGGKMPEGVGIRLNAEVFNKLDIFRSNLQFEQAQARALSSQNPTEAINALLRQDVGDDELGDDEFAGDDEVGADQPLEIQTGLWHGQAIAYCPRTGHMAIEPLRTQAAKLVKAGRLPEGLSGELIDGLESLHIGDDVILEMGDDVIGDDVIEVGRGKIAKKIGKGIKKAAKKTVKAAKAVAKSKLGKVLKTAISMTNPVAAVSIKALSKGASVAKKAKKAKTAKKKGKAPPKGTAKASKTLAIATARNKGKVSKKKATKVAKKNKIPKSDVKDTTQALNTIDAAQAGDPVAQSAVATHNQIETATETPLDPAQFEETDGGGGAPSDYGEEDDGSAPESESSEPYFDEGASEDEEPADEEELEEPDDGGDEEEEEE